MNPTIFAFVQERCWFLPVGSITLDNTALVHLIKFSVDGGSSNWTISPYDGVLDTPSVINWSPTKPLLITRANAIFNQKTNEWAHFFEPNWLEKIDMSLDNRSNLSMINPTFKKQLLNIWYIKLRLKKMRKEMQSRMQPRIPDPHSHGFPPNAVCLLQSMMNSYLVKTMYSMKRMHLSFPVWCRPILKWKKNTERSSAMSPKNFFFTCRWGKCFHGMLTHKWMFPKSSLPWLGCLSINTVELGVIWTHKVLRVASFFTIPPSKMMKWDVMQITATTARPNPWRHWCRAWMGHKPWKKMTDCVPSSNDRVAVSGSSSAWTRPSLQPWEWWC